MEPKNHPIDKDTHLPSLHFLGSKFIFRDVPRYIYPQAPSFATGPKILATENEFTSTFRVLNLGIGLGFHGSIAPSNTYHTPRLGFQI